MCTHPYQTDEQAPDETVLALFPGGDTDRGVRRKPVYADEDVRRREVETDVCQGL